MLSAAAASHPHQWPMDAAAASPASGSAADRSDNDNGGGVFKFVGAKTEGIAIAVPRQRRSWGASAAGSASSTPAKTTGASNLKDPFVKLASSSSTGAAPDTSQRLQNILQDARTLNQRLKDEQPSQQARQQQTIPPVFQFSAATPASAQSTTATGRKEDASSELRATVRMQEEEIAALRSKSAVADAAVKSQLDKALRRAALSETRVAQLTQDLSSAKQKMERMEAEMSSDRHARRRCDDLERTLKNLTTKSNATALDLERERRRGAQLEVDLKLARAEAAAAAATAATNNSNNANGKGEKFLETMRRRVVDAEKALAPLQAEVMLERRKQVTATEEARAARQRFEDLEVELGRLRERLRESEAELATARRERDGVDCLRRRLRLAEERVVELQGSLDDEASRTEEIVREALVKESWSVQRIRDLENMAAATATHPHPESSSSRKAVRDASVVTDTVDVMLTTTTTNDDATTLPDSQSSTHSVRSDLASLIKSEMGRLAYIVIGIQVLGWAVYIGIAHMPPNWGI